MSRAAAVEAVLLTHRVEFLWVTDVEDHAGLVRIYLHGNGGVNREDALRGIGRLSDVRSIDVSPETSTIICVQFSADST